MPLFRPEELNRFLQQLGRGAKRSLSQNFLVDGNIAKKIVAAVNPTIQDRIIEIGPGPGVLTELFFDTESFHSLVAIEMDTQFAEALPRLRKDETRPPLHVVSKDVLELTLKEIISIEDGANDRVKIVSNLPYHLTTPILKHILDSSELFSTLTLMVQHEVGQKMIATPGTRDFSYLALYLSYYAEKIEYCFFVPRSSFMPEPNVDSSVVQLTLRKRSLLSPAEEAHFFEISKKAFLMRRKTIGNSLKEFSSFFETAGIEKQARPETISLDQWLLLARSITSK